MARLTPTGVLVLETLLMRPVRIANGSSAANGVILNWIISAIGVIHKMNNLIGTLAIKPTNFPSLFL